ncbi:acid protease [Cytidiella melzeri]|nr:acid protease [Cytidiella melzeri]
MPSLCRSNVEVQAERPHTGWLLQVDWHFLQARACPRTVQVKMSRSSAKLDVRKNLVKLPIARRVNSTGILSLVERDQARARTLKTHSKARDAHTQLKITARTPIFNLPITNAAITYTATVQIGNPATTFNLIVDTGSSNTWVGANTPFTSTQDTVDTGETVFVEYRSGFELGEETLDTVSFGGITIPQQSFGVSLRSSGFSGVDGILGIGPTDRTVGTTSDGKAVPTVTDNAFALGFIDAKQVGVSFEPTTSLDVTNGELSFGGADPSQYTGTLHTVPITITSPASEYFGVNQSISYGSTTILSNAAGIVDTGTTLILLASDAFSAYQLATGAVVDHNTGLLSITLDQYVNLEDLGFYIGGETFTLTPNAQIWPRTLNTAIGGTADGIYLIVSDLGTPSGRGLDFFNGLTFLERFYTVFDSGADTVSFATTPHTTAITN